MNNLVLFCDQYTMATYAFVSADIIGCQCLYCLTLVPGSQYHWHNSTESSLGNIVYEINGFRKTANESTINQLITNVQRC